MKRNKERNGDDEERRWDKCRKNLKELEMIKVERL